MKQRRECPKGHVYFKSSDCPTCPTCESQKKPDAGIFAGLSAPACRALQGAGLTTAPKLSRKTEAQILELHGIGPSAMPRLRIALRKAGLAFKDTSR